MLAFILELEVISKITNAFYSIYHCFHQPQGLHCLLDMDRIYPSATRLVLSILIVKRNAGNKTGGVFKAILLFSIRTIVQVWANRGNWAKLLRK